MCAVSFPVFPTRKKSPWLDDNCLARKNSQIHKKKSSKNAGIKEIAIIAVANHTEQYAYIDKSLKEDLLELGYSFTSSQWKKFDDKIKSDILMNFRLAYLTDGDVNWCEELGTVLANDEIINLACESLFRH